MSPRWQSVAAAQHGVITARQAVEAGLSAADVRRFVRRREWVRLLYGIWFTHGSLFAEPPPLAHCSAASLAVPNGVLCGPAAARLHHLDGLGRFTDRCEIAVPSGHAFRLNSALRIRQYDIARDDICHVNGLPTTTVRRTLADLTLTLPRWEAVSTLDSALHNKVISPRDLPIIGASLAGRPGAVAGRARLEECDGRSESPLETRVRLICADGGLAPDDLQHRVRDHYGNTVGYGDLAWTRARLIAEADGRSVHGTPAAVYQDRRRANSFFLAGYDMVRFVWADTHRPAYIQSTIRRGVAA